MFRNTKVQMLLVGVTCALLGWAAASGTLGSLKDKVVGARPAVAGEAPAGPEVAARGGDDKEDKKGDKGKGGKKPNILFIMGDDIGWMQPSCYHRGLMVGETPNIDRIAREGALFMDYLAMQSCTSGRNAFVTGMYPLRTGMIPPQLPGSPSYLRPGTPCIAKFLLDLGYTTGQFGKN